LTQLALERADIRRSVVSETAPSVIAAIVGICGPKFEISSITML
jgi:hypothetical protein